MISQQQKFGIGTSHLVQVGKSQHLLTEQCAIAFLEMQKAAKKDDVDVQIISSFRDFKRQLSIWNRKWCGELPLYTLSGKKLNANQLSPEEKIHAIMLWSALPGASRHHWGTDLDVYDKRTVEQRSHKFQLVPEEYQPEGPCFELSNWLQKNAKDFGFVFPYAQFNGGVAEEPWHLSYEPESSKLIEDFTFDGLADILENSEIEGKENILSLLPTLFKRYTLNQGSSL